MAQWPGALGLGQRTVELREGVEAEWTPEDGNQGREKGLPPAPVLARDLGGCDQPTGSNEFTKDGGQRLNQKSLWDRLIGVYFSTPPDGPPSDRPPPAAAVEGNPQHKRPRAALPDKRQSI
jgi:hypothetical protein